MPKDPVCGMNVKESEAVTSQEDGKKQYFCSEACRDEFAQQQKKGAKSSGGKSPPPKCC